MILKATCAYRRWYQRLHVLTGDDIKGYMCLQERSLVIARGSRHLQSVQSILLPPTKNYILRIFLKYFYYYISYRVYSCHLQKIIFKGFFWNIFITTYYTEYTPATYKRLYLKDFFEIFSLLHIIQSILLPPTKDYI